MHSPTRSSDPGLPLLSALVLLGGFALIGLLAAFPPLRAAHPQFGLALWLPLAACIGYFPLRAGLLSTATRRAPAPLVVRTRRRRTIAPPAASAAVAEHASVRLPRGARRAGRRPPPRSVASS